MNGHHDARLVALAVVVAVAAAYTSLDLARRSRHSAPEARRYWLAAAGVALGGGIWSMHFVAMLAFQMPAIEMSYDVGLTTLSFLLAVSFTGFGFAVFSRKKISFLRLIAAGGLMALGIVAMHYVGMAAMQVHSHITYDAWWVTVSVLIAIFAAVASLLLAERDYALSGQVFAAGLMGLAISGMHFAGMKAATFGMTATKDSFGTSVGQGYLAAGIGVMTCIIMVFAIAAAKIDTFVQAMSRRNARVALRLEIADVLRGSGDKGALEQVALLMGKHFDVNRTGYALLDCASSEFDYEICWTNGTVPPLLGRYPAQAFGEKIVSKLCKGSTVAIGDLLESALSDEPATRSTANDVDTRSILVVPFVRESNQISIVYLNGRKPRVWHNDDIAFMEELAERTRLVIERNEALRRLQSVNIDLESRVEQRTAELREAQQALLQSQKMEAVGQLAAGLAHDFNNVLSGAMGAFELIARKPSDVDRVKRYAKAGFDAIERGSRLTGQLLSFSRLQAIQFRPVIICDVIKGLGELLKSTLGPMIELRYNLNPHPVPVMGDATQLEMMILNLAINARDAMPNGGTLTISTCVRSFQKDPELDGGRFVELAVSDTGHGMDHETLRRATEPFFTTKPVGKGTGLGLAQIYASARKAGGTVRLDSKVGQGTTVRVLLKEAEAVASALLGAEIASSALPLLRIIVVDDELVCRETLCDMLEDEGHNVLSFESGMELFAHADLASVDVYILDYAMPDMNGAAIAQKLRESFPSVPIVFATGYADSEQIENVLGTDAVLVKKPFHWGDLKFALSRALSVHSRTPH